MKSKRGSATNDIRLMVDKTGFAMNWSRIKCAVFGHKWKVVAGRHHIDVTAPADCARCAAHRSGLEWNRPNPIPMPRPARSKASRVLMKMEATYGTEPPKREEIKPLTPEQRKPIAANLVRIADYSYHAHDGSLQRVSLRKEGDETPVLTVNGIAHRLDWLSD